MLPLIAFGLALAWPESLAAAESTRPNLLLLVTDDQGPWDLGSAGNPQIDTPHLDALAKSGVSFARYYVAPVCAPTRAGLMTGRYAFRTGLYNTRFGGDSMALGEVTVAQLLKAAGYRTGLFGKWHLGRYHGYQPHQRGFDEFLGHYQGHIERYEYADQFVHNGRPVETRGYVTELVTDAAIDFMDETKRRAPASHVDLLPTLCELAGVPVPADRPIDGRSLVPVLRAGAGERHQPFVYHTWNRMAPTPDANWAISDQRFKLLGAGGGSGKKKAGGWELFDLDADPGERTNVAAAHPDKVFEAYDWDTIEGWSRPGEAAEWRLEVVRAGRYEVALDYGCAPAAAGGRLQLALGGTPLELTTQATATANVFKRSVAGVVTLPAGPATLRAAVAAAPPTGELMRLNRVWLRRID